MPLTLNHEKKQPNPLVCCAHPPGMQATTQSIKAKYGNRAPQLPFCPQVLPANHTTHAPPPEKTSHSRPTNTRLRTQPWYCPLHGAPGCPALTAVGRPAATAVGSQTTHRISFRKCPLALLPSTAKKCTTSYHVHHSSGLQSKAAAQNPDGRRATDNKDPQKPGRHLQLAPRWTTLH